MITQVILGTHLPCSCTRRNIRTWALLFMHWFCKTSTDEFSDFQFTWEFCYNKTLRCSLKFSSPLLNSENCVHYLLYLHVGYTFGIKYFSASFSNIGAKCWIYKINLSSALWKWCQMYALPLMFSIICKFPANPIRAALKILRQYSVAFIWPIFHRKAQLENFREDFYDF